MRMSTEEMMDGEPGTAMEDDEAAVGATEAK